MNKSLTQAFQTQFIRDAHPFPEFFENRGIALRRCGASYIGKCPLHQERHGESFVVDPKAQTWSCFGKCGHRRKDVIDWVRIYHGLSFREACEELGAVSNPKFQAPNPKQLPSSNLQIPNRILVTSAQSQLSTILERYASPNWEAELWHRSPVRLVHADTSNDWRLLLSHIFAPDDRIWMGEPFDSGKERHAKHFRPVSKWIAREKPIGWRITAATFPPGCFQRRKDQVQSVRYRLIESDELIGKKPESESEKQANKRLSAALITWLMEAGIPIAAVMDSGNKSLHAWAEVDAETLQELGEAAAALRLDDKFNDPAAPLRLPGCVHEVTGRRARLLYLDQCDTGVSPVKELAGCQFHISPMKGGTNA